MRSEIQAMPVKKGLSPVKPGSLGLNRFSLSGRVQIRFVFLFFFKEEAGLEEQEMGRACPVNAALSRDEGVGGAS